jgi:hypothetical protein
MLCNYVETLQASSLHTQNATPNGGGYSEGMHHLVDALRRAFRCSRLTIRGESSFRLPAYTRIAQLVFDKKQFDAGKRETEPNTLAPCNKSYFAYKINHTPHTASNVPTATFGVTRSRKTKTESGTPINGAAVLSNAARAAPAKSTVSVHTIIPIPVLYIASASKRGKFLRV